MTQYTVTAPEKERRKKMHTMSKSRLRPGAPRVSPSAPNLQVQNPAPAVQPASSHHVNAQQPYWHDPIRSPQTQPIATPHHPIYGQMPYNPSQYGLPPASVNPTYTSPPAVRITSPPPKKTRQDGYLKENWNKLDKMATKSYSNLRDTACKSTTKLTTDYIERPTYAVASKSMKTLCKSAALCDIISTKFDAVMTSIDNERFSGKEQDLIIYNAPPPELPSTTTIDHQADLSRRLAPDDAVYQMLETTDKGSNYFSKVWLYSNSRLPPYLPPFKVYLPTWPLICLAATYSERVYTPPAKSSETETHVRSDWRSGTKAMVLKSVPVEDLNTIVFAIRGSQTFMDWAVNYNSAPSSPENFLDDASNLCHAGFLYVARKMIKPVAERLRKLLEENPARSNCSLLITGHSAGGAVAALLYAHMMNRTVQSDLNYLTGFFKRVHCITFGAPPVSLRPLQKPDSKRHRKSLFYSFINEGDPVPRADKNVVKSLLKLYATPMPNVAGSKVHLQSGNANANGSYTSSTQTQKSKYRLPTLAPRLTKPSKTSLQSITSSSTSSALPSWPVPTCTLAPAGRLVVLRQPPGSRNEADEAVEAVTVEVDALKKVVFGDPLKHQMRVYQRRIEGVATRAVTARGH